MNGKQNWFEVDKVGLAKVLGRRGKELALFELLQNSWDEAAVTEVIVTTERTGRSIRINVTDDAPDGFADLTHAWTLFAESAKKNNPLQRGRFNLGDKLVFALAEQVIIVTTRGSVIFDKDGRRRGRTRRERGSDVSVLMKMTLDEEAKLNEAVRKLIACPAGIRTTFNGRELERRKPVKQLEKCLKTETCDESGILKSEFQMVTVTLYPVGADERATLYEMGIPVCETGDADKWHYDVGQKIPLTMDRTGVSAAWLSDLRAEVLNDMLGELTAEQASQPWVAAGIEHSSATSKTVQAYMEKRFGAKRVSYDPSDAEANKRAVAAGYTVVHGGMLSAEAWDKVRSAEAILPAGKVTPSAKVWTGEGNPDATPFRDWIEPEDWSPGMRDKADYAKIVARLLFGEITVRFCSTPNMVAAAAYGGRGLDFNLFRLGRALFDEKPVRCVEFDDLLIHELAHEYSSDHLSEDYYRALTRIGARLIEAARGGKL